MDKIDIMKRWYTFKIDGGKALLDVLFPPTQHSKLSIGEQYEIIGNASGVGLLIELSHRVLESFNGTSYIIATFLVTPDNS
uniref:Uncharacterized protein n=1 Tax=viral metagenome TaxID=1070528 RepID=A0A6M3JS31_9ZZZZ